MITQKILPSRRPLGKGLRTYAALLAVGPALAACSGWPYSAGNPHSLATYDPPLSALENDSDYKAPMRGNYIVERWNLGREQRAAAANQPALASAATGMHIPTSFLQSLDSDYASYSAVARQPSASMGRCRLFRAQGACRLALPVRPAGG
jgi:hypothetical protein